MIIVIHFPEYINVKKYRIKNYRKKKLGIISRFTHVYYITLNYCLLITLNANFRIVDWQENALVCGYVCVYDLYYIDIYTIYIYYTDINDLYMII